MNLTVKIKLLPSESQRESLFKTFSLFNRAANMAAEAGYSRKVFSQPSIHKLVYYQAREETGLTSQLVVRAIGKAVECFKRNKKRCPVFKPRSAVVYDNRIMRFKNLDVVSIATADGRMDVPIVVAGYQSGRLQDAIKTGQADLVYVDGDFYLLLSIQTKDPEQLSVTGTIGVDLGISQIAVDSLGNTYTGDDVEEFRTRIQSRRSALQKLKTRSAKRALKRIRRKEANYRRSKNHEISRRIVDTAKALSLGIALENLNGIRRRTRFRKSQRARMSGWAFHQLRAMIEYKAAMAGIPVVLVNPRNTSRTCSKCGYCNKQNRKSQAVFECGICGHREHADLNASRNIALQGSVNLPMVASVEAEAGLVLN